LNKSSKFLKFPAMVERDKRRLPVERGKRRFLVEGVTRGDLEASAVVAVVGAWGLRAARRP
jgi:hypothetical protein